VEIRQQFGDVSPQMIDVGELRFGDVEHVEMHPHAIAREAGGDFAAHNHVGSIGNRQRSGDRVVIGDGHKIHPARLRTLIHAFRRVVRLVHDQAERVERGTSRVDGMHVRVELQIASLTPACGRRVAKAATPDECAPGRVRPQDVVGPRRRGSVEATTGP
jgi:hypothetical protein